MPFVGAVEPEAATGLLKEQYALVHRVLGGHANLARAWSLQPEIADAWLKPSNVAREKSGLDIRQYEILLVADAIVPNALGPEFDNFSANFRRVANWKD